MFGLNGNSILGGFKSLGPLILKGKNLEPFAGEISFKDPKGATKLFQPHYDEHIRPQINEFEQNRIEALRKLRKRVIIVAPIFPIIIATAIYLLFNMGWGEEGNKAIAFVTFAILGGLTAWCHSPVRNYKSDVKYKIFPRIFSFFEGGFEYSEIGLLPIESLKSSDIIPSYSSNKTEDYVKGSYKDVTLELTEAILEKQSGKHRKTVFNGMFILLNMNKNFSGKTIVKKDGGKIGNWFSSKFKEMDNVNLEDPVFEKQFEVYSTDQVEARYLLTTSFMERLLKLSRVFGGGGIQCSFYDDKLLLMVSSDKNHFETASIFQPATFVDDVNIILEEMDLIFQIVDILKLDQNIGM